MDIDIEALILSISLIISIIALVVGLVRGLKAAHILGGGLLSMVMIWIIFIAILTAMYTFIYFTGISQDNEMLKIASNLFLLLIPICLLRIIWGFADYVSSLQKMIEED
jgi:hypothetical protein